MMTKASLVLDEKESAFVADAILLLAAVIQGNAEVYTEVARLAAQAMHHGVYSYDTAQECIKMVEKPADKWNPDDS